MTNILLFEEHNCCDMNLVVNQTFVVLELVRPHPARLQLKGCELFVQAIMFVLYLND